MSTPIEPLQVRAHQGPWAIGIDILIRTQTHVAAPLFMEPLREGLTIPPTLSLTQDSAQILMDDLWHAGVRPTEGRGTAGSMRATENHLEDMRAIVFNRLGVPLP